MIVKNGRVARSGAREFEALDVRITGERISEIGRGLSGDGPILDARGLCVLPGGIDPHVHFDDPGYTHREDFYHGSCAAAAGGITTVIDMPCTSVPPVTNASSLGRKLDAIGPKSVVDYGLYGGVRAQSFEGEWAGHMEEIAADVMGFKTYFVSGMESFGRLNHYQFRQVLDVARELGRPVLLHAEDYDYVTAATPVYRRHGDSPADYYGSRPEAAETLAVLAAVELAEGAGADLHIVHLGTAAAGRVLRGRGATGETAPHYLAFTLDDFRRVGSPLKITPPLKPGENREELWELLADGTIDFVASDHAPCPAEEKGTGSIWTDYSGIPGCGTLLPYVFSEGYVKGRITLQRTLEVISENAARRYGFADRKGSIAVGKDADLVLIDPQSDWVVRGQQFHSKGKITPFEGVQFRGRIVKTVLRGKVIYDAGEGILAPGGYGRMLRPLA
ncbi:MAG: dihydroorotase family protein [Anaerolineae bacterium]|nr:dihydroorotase family protein [Anaerolineae bacterium]